MWQQDWIGLVQGASRSLTRSTPQVKASHTLTPVFDDPNLIGTAGLPVLRLAETSGLYEHLDRLSVPCPTAATKTVA